MVLTSLFVGNMVLAKSQKVMITNKDTTIRRNILEQKFKCGNKRLRIRYGVKSLFVPSARYGGSIVTIKLKKVVRFGLDETVQTHQVYQGLVNPPKDSKKSIFVDDNHNNYYLKISASGFHTTVIGQFYLTGNCI